MPALTALLYHTVSAASTSAIPPRPATTSAASARHIALPRPGPARAVACTSRATPPTSTACLPTTRVGHTPSSTIGPSTTPTTTSATSAAPSTTVGARGALVLNQVRELIAGGDLEARRQRDSTVPRLPYICVPTITAGPTRDASQYGLGGLGVEIDQRHGVSASAAQRHLAEHHVLHAQRALEHPGEQPVRVSES